MVCFFRYYGYGRKGLTMIEWLKNYILSLVSVSVIGLILECLLSQGNVKKFAMFGVSIILSLSLIQPIFNLKTDFEIPTIANQQVNIDYETAIKSTVNSITGYEDAFVSVVTQNNEIKKVTIVCSGEKLLDKAAINAKKDYVIKIINAVYGVEKENIYFSE